MTMDGKSAIGRAARSVGAVALSIPTREIIESELGEAENAQNRGYFLPDEDDRLRELFARYLSARVVLLEAVDSMRPECDYLSKGDAEWSECLRAFIVGFTAGALLVRMGSFVVDFAASRPVVVRKLDEPESRYGIPKKSFTEVYKMLGSSRRMWRFHEALLFWEANRKDIELMARDSVVGELVSILREEESFLRYRKRDYAKRKLDYSLHSFRRRHVSGYKKVMFHLFKLSGSAIAEIRQPFVKMPWQGKRVTAEVMEVVRPLLRAGDVVVTRHDDAMSNLFLPGFWPHAALYIGGVGEREQMGVPGVVKDGCCGDGVCFLESKKDGVLFRGMEETLHVDAFMVLRPKLGVSQVAESLIRAMSHEGKLYDFSFDFSQSQRLACTELIYRGYHGVGPVAFKLSQHHGRSCISAEDLIEQALGSGSFVRVLDFGVEGVSVRLF